MIHLDSSSVLTCQSERSNCIVGGDIKRQLLPSNQVAQATMGPDRSDSSHRELMSKQLCKTKMLIKMRTYINLEETKRNTTKTYHPFTRLLSSAKLSLQLLAILTLVPIKPTYLQLVEANNNPILGVPQFHRTHQMVNNFAFIDNQNQEWTRRMLRGSNDLQQEHHIIPRFNQNPNPNPASLLAELRDGQPIYRANVRQTLLADFVANQGQRILKNLVNNTIGDIVSQSAIRLATKSLIPQGQQFLLQQLQQQQQQQQQQPPPLANYQMLQNENINNRYFPTMGKLYTLLFPNNQLASQQSLVKAPPSSAINQTSNNPSPAEAIQPSSSNNQNMYLKSQRESPISQFETHKDHSNREQTFHREKQVVNLIAPYDSRPRKSISTSNFQNSSSEPTVSQTTSPTSRFEAGKRARRDKSRPIEQRPGLNQRPSNTIAFDQVPESVVDEVGSGENGAIPAGLDPESMSQFETSDLMQSNQGMPEEQQEFVDDRNNKSEVNPVTKDDHLESSMMEQSELQQSGDRAANEMQQLTSSSDFSGFFGARKNHNADNERDQTDGQNLAVIEAQMGQLNQHGGQQNQNQVEEHHANHKNNQLEGADYLINDHENQSPSQSLTIDEDGISNQGEMHLIDQQKQQRQQQTFENATSDKRDSKMEGRVHSSSLAGLTNLDSGVTERFKTSLMNETQNDDSFLAIKLPSQYDAVIRIPPEGYYDDYFKPVSSNIALQSSSAQTSASLLNSDANGISEYPTISQTQREPVRPAPRGQGGEHFEIEQEGLTNGQPINSSSQQNHNYHDASNQANFIPLSMDDAKQFYSNQQSVKPNEANVEHSIEIFPNQTNQTTTSANKKHEIINYELPAAAYENFHNDSPSHASNLNSSGLSNTNGRNNSHKYVHSFDNNLIVNNNNNNNERTNSSATNSHYLDQNENDSIQVIIANTNNSRDPISNEKVINYTSDGQNITKLAGKPARNTFVNKDMNELPPADEQNYQRDTLVNNIMPERNIIRQQRQQVTGLDQQQSDHNEDNSFKQQVQAPNFTLEQSQLSLQSNGKPKSLQNGSDEERDMESGPESDNDTNEIRRVTSKESVPRSYNNNNNAAHDVDESSDTAKMSPKMDMMRGYHFERNNNMNLVVRDRRQKNDRGENHVENQKRPRAQNGQKHSATNHPKMSKNSRNHGTSHRLHKQQTLRRPQVTQAYFDPKDLITNAPTPSPSVTESTIESISELPAKVKRLKHNQPDKNELMNELLTALDRVKVAIYKLQPLTAKMNAIYRKSVTSNTRDIIMDNHKGTYAKRYPPGDYDDSYDRMHPSELISRDRSSNSNSNSNNRSGRARRANSGGSIEANESTSNAIYLPAPKEILESYERNYTSSIKEQPVSKSIIEIKNLGESQIVATGIGRRLGDGRIRGELDVNSGDKIMEFDDSIEDDGKTFREKNATSLSSTSQQQINSSSMVDSAAPVFMPVKQLLEEDPQSPLFGYRITIFQSPGGEVEDEDANKNRDRFSYSTEGLLNSLENSSNGYRDNESSEFEGDSSPVSSEDQETKGTTTRAPALGNEDSMVTSESSMVEQQLTTSPSSISANATVQEDNDDDGDEPDESESKKKEEKKSIHESEKEKKSHKEQGKKKKEGSKKSSSKKKKQEEEKKKKKEYKKIKHDKKVVSKEKKSMKRDKHIKAHDRGAAKEKALKERTQIEFFEREQIVDDEFEKGKKSTVKAGWETGHDSKKTMKDTSSGDPMSVGGSHHIAQHVKEKHMEKGSGIKLAASSAKKSNKFEKKNMEARGKKFKGWREKGYKIITETEFIDRGSLHDSAYKKRDKGAAHHQKYKKHQASSEGHHGSMHVHHKKSAKEEKKKSKMHEKKAMNSKKSEKEGKKHEKKGGKKKKEKSDEKHSAASSEEPVEVKVAGDTEEDTLEGKESVEKQVKKPVNFVQPVLLAAGSSSFLTPKNSHSTNSDSVLSRLLNANHHGEPVGLIRGEEFLVSGNSSSALNSGHSTSNSTNLSSKLSEAASRLSKTRLIDFSGADEASRRSDIPTARVASMQRQSPLPNLQNVSSSLDSRSNATILDIVDNLTGRQMNKAKIGTYELEDHHNFNNRALNNSSSGVTNNSSFSAPKQSNGAKYFSPPLQATFQSRDSSNMNTDGTNNDNSINQVYISTTTRPQINKAQAMRQQLEEDDESRLLSILHRAQRIRQLGQENRSEPVKAQVSSRQLDRGFVVSTSLVNKSTTQSNPYSPTTYLTPEQAKLAANLLHLVQQANEASKANSGPMAASNQHTSLLESNLVQNRNQFNSQATSFIPSPQISGAYQAVPPAIYNNPAHMNHFAESAELRTFGNDQFLDYEQDPLSRSQKTFIIG